MANNKIDLNDKIHLLENGIYENIELIGKEKINKDGNVYYTFRYCNDKRLSVMPGVCGKSIIDKQLSEITLVRNKFIENDIEYSNVSVIGFLTKEIDKMISVHEKELNKYFRI